MKSVLVTWILDLLNKFEKQVDTSRVQELKTPGFSLTYDLMGQHLRETSYPYEREIYQMACHTFGMLAVPFFFLFGCLFSGQLRVQVW